MQEVKCGMMHTCIRGGPVNMDQINAFMFAKILQACLFLLSINPSYPVLTMTLLTKCSLHISSLLALEPILWMG